MCTLIEALHPYQQLGYTFSQSDRSVHLLQYADDTCLIGSGPASCQELLRPVERWLQWTGMRAKPAKCHSLGIRASTGRSFDPALTIDGEPIPFIRNEAIKFLGKAVQVPLDTSNIKSQVVKQAFKNAGESLQDTSDKAAKALALPSWYLPQDELGFVCQQSPSLMGDRHPGSNSHQILEKVVRTRDGRY